MIRRKITVFRRCWWNLFLHQIADERCRRKLLCVCVNEEFIHLRRWAYFQIFDNFLLLRLISSFRKETSWIFHNIFLPRLIDIIRSNKTFIRRRVRNRRRLLCFHFREKYLYLMIWIFKSRSISSVDWRNCQIIPEKNIRIESFQVYDERESILLVFRQTLNLIGIGKSLKVCRVRSWKEREEEVSTKLLGNRQMGLSGFERVDFKFDYK